EAGQPAKVVVRPQTAVATVDIDVTTGVKGSPTLTLLDAVGPRQFTVRGSVPVGGKPVVRILPVDDPAGFARGLFIEALRELGVDVKAISFGGGAGGANADWVTPRAAVQLLSGMAKRPEWPAFKAGLPSLGVDGTLVDVVGKDSPARGKVFAKTGTLFWSDL